jgi:hypothetical protein
MVATASRTRLLVSGAVAVGIAIVVAVVVTQLGSGPSAPTDVAAPSIASPVGPGKPLHARVGHWHHAPSSYAYQWQACPRAGGSCADIPGATGASYTPPLADRPQAYRVRVTARNRTGRTSVLSARTSPVPPAPAGAPGPAVSCTQTLAPGANLQTALSNADPGQVICLDAGDWGAVTLTRVAPTGNVTLAAAPGQSVHLGSLTIEGQSDSPSATDNLTIRGFWIDHGVSDLTDTTGGLVFEHNTITRIRQGYGFYFNPDGNGGSHTQSGVKIVSNRISQVGECLAIVGEGRGFTFSHNVCGPGIGYGDTASTQPSHYIEVGGVDGLSVTANAFLGPSDPNSDQVDLHLNVLHLFGGGRHVDFSGNLLWHTQARGQAILLQEGHFDDVRIDDNLDVEDPACGQHSGCANYMAEVADAHGLSFQNNTVVGAAYGVLLTESDESGDYSGGNDYVITHNVVVGASGAPAISYGGCTSSCVFDYNVTDDGSAAKAHAAHGVTNWSPAWRAGSRYQAAGIPFTAGYSGMLPPG